MKRFSILFLGLLFLTGAAQIPAACNPPPPPPDYSVDCAGGPHDTITLSDKNGVIVKNCNFTLNSFIKLTHVSNAQIDNNTFTADAGLLTIAPSLYIDTQGTNNRFTRNTIYGAGTADAQGFHGADDGIIMQNSTAAILQDNVIDQVYDCGIEGVGSLTNSYINHNTISNARTCGIGAWSDLAFQNVQVTNNTITTSGLMFRFFWQGDNQTSGFFTDNTFTNNSSSSMTTTVQNSVFYADAPIVEHGNHFGGNDFAHLEQFAPQFLPNDTSWTNDGGNLCGTRSQSGGSVVCP